jgi:hypothetical protein
MMLDEARGRLRLTSAQLDALGLAARQDPADDAAAAGATRELQAAGVLDEQRRLHPLAAELAYAASVPLIRFLVEATGPQGTAVSHVLVAGEAVWSSEPWPGEGPDQPVVYQRSELPTVVWDLGRLVGLHRAQVPPDAVPASVPVEVADSVLSLAGTGPQDWDEVRTVTLARGRELWPGFQGADLDRWLALVASLRSWWRITAGWGEPGEGRWLSVLDCGPEGYWRWDIPDQAGDGEDVVASTTTRLVPVSGGDLWSQIQGLLPDAAELRAATGGRGA